MATHARVCIGELEEGLRVFWGLPQSLSGGTGAPGVGFSSVGGRREDGLRESGCGHASAIGRALDGLSSALQFQVRWDAEGSQMPHETV